MWRHVVVEGYCFGDFKDNEAPCGRAAVSSFCLSNGLCPHFAYTRSDEREASAWVPLPLILKDRIRAFLGDAGDKIKWWLWDKWFFKKKWAEFMEYAHAHTAECPVWDDTRDKANAQFPKWLKKAKEDE